MEKRFFVYLLTNKPRGVLYIGLTSDLPRRLWEHREKVRGGFTARYNLSRLVWYEAQADAASAIAREKQLKKWNRAWKIELIERDNPAWRNLHQEVGAFV